MVQKVKIISWSWNLVPTLIQICRIQLWCSLFLFLSGNTLFGQIWSKKLKFLFQAEIWYLHEFEHAEFNGGVHFFCFWVEMLFLGKFGPKSQNYQFKLKFGTYTNSNMKNSMVNVHFSVFDWAYAFWANLVEKIKIGSSRWNSRLKLIQVCRIQWWCSLFLFLSGNTLFGQIWSKKSKFSA